MINGVQFINGYKWVDTYYNGRKVAGSQLVDVSGEMLSVPNTYDDSAYIKMYGKTVEIGEGDKSPDNPYELKSVGDDGGFDLVSAGKNLLDISNYVPRSDIVYNPAMSNQISLNGTSASRYIDFNVFVPANTRIQVSCESSTDFMQWYMLYYDDTLSTSYASGWSRLTQKDVVGIRIYGLPSNLRYTPCTLSNITLYIDVPDLAVIPYTPFRGMQTINFPYTLRSLPDGTCDYIEIDDINKSAKLVENIGEYAFDGTEDWSVASTPRGEYWSRYFFPPQPMLTGIGMSGRCTHYKRIDWAEHKIGIRFGQVNAVIYLTTEYEDVNDLKAFLASEHGKGTPVTVQYPIAEPITTPLDYEEIKTYYPYTQIYTTATVQPTLDGKFRVWGS